MINAKEELIELLSEDEYKNKCILCARIAVYHVHILNIKLNNLLIILKKDYSEQDYSCFLDNLNFEYDNKSGLEILHGVLLFEDNTWFERSSYHGYEFWDYKCFPKIPEQCL